MFKLPLQISLHAQNVLMEGKVQTQCQTQKMAFIGAVSG
jgi:hypothetical protein